MLRVIRVPTLKAWRPFGHSRVEVPLELSNRFRELPTVALLQPVGDVLCDVAEDVTPCPQFVDVAILRVRVHPEEKRQIRFAVREPESDHLCSVLVALNSIWYP